MLASDELDARDPLMEGSEQRERGARLSGQIEAERENRRERHPLSDGGDRGQDDIQGLSTLRRPGEPCIFDPPRIHAERCMRAEPRSRAFDGDALELRARIEDPALASGASLRQNLHDGGRGEGPKCLWDEKVGKMHGRPRRASVEDPVHAPSQHADSIDECLDGRISKRTGEARGERGKRTRERIEHPVFLRMVPRHRAR